MSNERKSVQKARFEQLLHEGAGTKGERRGVQYTRLDGEKAPEETRKATKFVADFTKEEAAILKDLKPGDEFVVQKVEQKWTNKEGKEMTSWNLDTVKSIDTWVEPPAKKPWDGGKSGSWKGGKSEWKDSGPAAKVGGLYHDAAAIISRRKDIDELSLEWISEKMATLVRLMVKDAIAIEEEIKSGANAEQKPSSAKIEPNDPKPTTVRVDACDDFFADLGAVPFE